MILLIFLFILIFFIILLVFLPLFPFKGPFDDPNSLWKLNSGSIYLTFDDGPNSKITSFVLDQLKRNNQKATFFLIPEFIRKSNHYIVKRIVDEGHTIGLHGNSRLLAFQSRRYVNDYILKFNKKVSLILKKEFGVKYFRPPSLWRNIWVYDILRKHDVKLVGVSKFCWIDAWVKNSDKMVERFEKNLVMGNIYVMHDGKAEVFEPDLEEITIILPELFEKLKTNNIISKPL